MVRGKPGITSLEVAIYTPRFLGQAGLTSDVPTADKARVKMPMPAASAVREYIVRGSFGWRNNKSNELFERRLIIPQECLPFLLLGSGKLKWKGRTPMNR